MERKEINANFIDLIDKFRSKLKNSTDIEEKEELRLAIKEIKKEHSEYNKIDKDNKMMLGGIILFGAAMTLFSVGIAMSNEGNSMFGEFVLHSLPAIISSMCTAKTIKEIFSYVSRQNKNNAASENFINECSEILNELEEENENVRTR